jgi:hypothetical protein
MNSRSICWYSTPESLVEGKVSVLAVSQTILSAAAYWWIAVAFDTYLHLVTSIVIAPWSCFAPRPPSGWGLRCWIGLRFLTAKI